MASLKPVEGKRASTRGRKRSSVMVRLAVVPLETDGFSCIVLGAEDLLPRKLAQTILVTVPEEALGMLP